MKLQVPEWMLPTTAKARRRIQRMTEQEIGVWVDVAGSEMARCIRDYLKDREQTNLVGFEEGVATLAAIAQELRSRV